MLAFSTFGHVVVAEESSKRSNFSLSRVSLHSLQNMRVLTAILQYTLTIWDVDTTTKDPSFHKNAVARVEDNLTLLGFSGAQDELVLASGGTRLQQTAMTLA